MKFFSALVGLLIGLFFAGVGIVIALETAVPTYQNWQTMKDWQSTSATLLTVKASANNTEATYRYAIYNNEYQNDRVYVASFTDNIGSYHQQMYEKLQAKKENDQPITIWYNPDNPSQSVIDKDMRWGLFALMSGFCLVFILIGMGVSIACLKTSKPVATKNWKQYHASSNSAKIPVKPKHPRFQRYQQQGDITEKNKTIYNSQPWLNKKEWRTNRIRSDTKSIMIGLWVFAIIWTTVSSTSLLMLETELNKENYAALLVLLFPLIGLFLLKKAWNMTREWNRFGVIELEMDPFPGSIGGHIGGSLLIKNSVDFSAKYQIELECVHSYESGSGKNRSRNENIKWAEAGDAKVVAAAGGIRVRFRFDVPEHLPESDIESSRNYYFWRLKLKSKLAGVDLNREYNIPVFKTSQQSTKIRHDVSAQAEQVRENKALKSQAAISRGDFSSTPLARALRYKDEGNKQVFYFPMFRNKGITLFALIFAGGFSFAAYSISQDFFDGDIMGWIMLIFSIPFALVGFFATIAVIYLPLNNLTTTLMTRKIITRRRLFIFPIQYNVITGNEIQQIEIKSTGSTGQGSQQIMHFKLIVHSKNHKKMTIAEDIDGEDVAEQLKEFISKRLFI